MRRDSRLIVLITLLAALVALRPADISAQRRHAPRHGVVVFVGGYFYDPFFGPYPWWSRGAYPYPYYPVFDNRAEVRLLVTPQEAGVYVDGFYAGIVDDFNGFFQALPLPPGGHEIVLYLAGYRTVHRRVYLAPGSTFKLHHTMERLSAGETSEPPAVAPPIPPPPVGTFTPPVTPRAGGTPLPPPPPISGRVAPLGTLSLRVQPANADVTIDGERWASSDGERFVIQLAAGLHRLRVTMTGYQGFSMEIQLRDGETTPLNVSLTQERPR
jgi:hypothetical protein